jgi:hypothetical protein
VKAFQLTVSDIGGEVFSELLRIHRGRHEDDLDPPRVLTLELLAEQNDKVHVLLALVNFV